MKISKRHLSLRGLRTFTLVARHLSFRMAAEELFLTASAVSHQIKNLEGEVGTPLFERQHRMITLTDAGRALYTDVGALIDALDRVTSPYVEQQQRKVLRLSVQPYFASELLMPNLADFSEQHPNIDIHLDSTDEHSHRHPASVDASVRVFHSAPSDLVADAFYPLRQVPGCSPGLLKRLTATGDALAQPFPMIVHSERKNDWQNFARNAGIALPPASQIIELNSMVAVVNAACEGVGVGLIPMPLSARHFDSGRLVRACGFETDTPDRYYFVSTREAASTKPVQALRSWVLRNFAEVA